MANAIRAITVEQGAGSARACLMAFGGAGPLFGTLLARELELTEIVVPPYAGNFSAWGLLGADLTQATARTRIMRLDDEAVADANAILDELFAERRRPRRRARRRTDPRGRPRHALRRAGAHADRTGVPSVDGRISCERDRGPRPPSRATTSARSATRWTRTSRSSRSARRSAPRCRACRTGARLRQRPTGRPPTRSGRAYSFARNERLPFAIVDRAGLEVGVKVSGPGDPARGHGHDLPGRGLHRATLHEPASSTHRRSESHERRANDDYRGAPRRRRSRRPTPIP